MSDVSLVVRQVGYEQRSFWRNPASAFFTFIFPFVFLVALGTLNSGSHATVGGVQVNYNDYQVPALLAFAVMGACFTNIAISTSIRRDSGVLKRLRGTPLPPWVFMCGLIGSSVIISVMLVALTTGFGMLAYHISAPQHPLALAVTLIVGAMCFCALGLALSPLIPNADAAPAVVNGVFLPLVLLSGSFFPVPADSLVTTFANLFPVRHFTIAVFNAFDPGRNGSPQLLGTDLLVLAAWGVVGLLVAVKRFRWEPRKT